MTTVSVQPGHAVTTSPPYSRSAAIYDVIYASRKSYRSEAAKVCELVSRATGRMPLELGLLDMACGTGLHLEHLAPWFSSAVGMDLSEEQLAVARRRLPGLQLVRRDMRDLHDLKVYFDVVTCLFSAIGHMTTREQLYRAIDGMGRTLLPGGVLLIEPWLHPDVFRSSELHTDFADTNGIKVTRYTYTSREGDISRLEMHHMVAGLEPGQVDYFVECYELGLWSQAEYEAAFQAAGLNVTFHPDGLSDNGRGVYVGIKPS